MRWPTSLTSLRHRNYRLLWAGTAMTQTGQWAQQVATGWLVLDMTGSGFYLGLAGFLRSIPQLFFSIPGGILADRMDRKKLLGTYPSEEEPGYSGRVRSIFAHHEGASISQG